MNVKLDERFKKVAAIIGAAGAKYSSIAHAKKIAYVNSGYSSVNMLCDFQCNRIIGFWKRSLISLACVSSETHNLQSVFRPGRVVSYIGYIGMCRAKGYGFFTCFGLKYGINFDHIGLK